MVLTGVLKLSFQITTIATITTNQSSQLSLESPGLANQKKQPRMYNLNIPPRSGLFRSTRRISEDMINSPIRIQSEAQLLELGLPGKGTQEDPYLISGLVILEDFEPYSRGIVINNTKSFIKIMNCSVTGRTAVEIENAVNLVIANCEFQAMWFDLKISQCHNLQIYNNTGYESASIGDSPEISISRSYDIAFFKNTCPSIKVYRGSNINLTENLFRNDNYIAIAISGSNNTRIVNNYCVNPGNTGINLYESSQCSIVNNFCNRSKTGISLVFGCDTNKISNNTILNCSRGISILGAAEENIIKENIVIGNVWGIIFEPDGRNLFHKIFSANNQVFKNVFQDSRRQGGYDSGKKNGYAYNFWSDWVTNSSDDNQDGILDDPYPLEGGNNYDPCPLASRQALEDITITSITIPPSTGIALEEILLGGSIILGFLVVRNYRKRK
ncbi:MAG: right-handed parallel beta-helix repeat-containing protein [Candidatus Hodarchaeales archaeon]